MLRLYFAAPLFSVAERAFNQELTNILSDCFNVYLPQRDGALMVNLVNNGWSLEDARRYVFQADIEAIVRCDVMLAILDGPAIDDGVSFELGVAFATGKVCVGLATDFRRDESFFNNPMWRVPLLQVFRNKEALLKWSREFTSEGEYNLNGHSNGHLGHFVLEEFQ